MKILKRNGSFENLSFDKILFRIRKLCNDTSLGLLSTIDPDLIAQKTVSSIYDGVSSSELDEEAARISIGMIENMEYPQLASRIIISNIQKNTRGLFSDIMEKLYKNTNKLGEHSPIITEEGINIIRKYSDVLNSAIVYHRDYLFDYFGYKTFEKSYLLKMNGTVMECPQHLYMRVAIQMHKDDIDNILKTYNYISQHYYTFASPSMFNALTPMNNLSSCFHKDTLVYTVNRGPVPISQIVVGDQVTTHLGNVKKVVQLHKNALGDRKMYEIYTNTGLSFIKVTGNHRLFTERGLLPVEQLELGDFIKIPQKNNSFINNKQFNFRNLYHIIDGECTDQYNIELHYLLIQFIGCFIVNGFTHHDTVFMKYIPSDLAFHTTMKQLINNRIGKDFVCYKSETFTSFLKRYYYNCIDLYKWDHNMISAFVKGLNMSHEPISDNYYIELLHNNGFVYENNLFIEKAFVELKMKRLVKETDLSEYVYTLGIEDDHSYSVGGIVAENCFLLGTEDSVEGIFKTMSDTAKISKVGGGIGLHVHNIRSKGSIIKGTNGVSDGIIPMLKVYNSISVYINQSGKRKGSFAIYISPEHPDIFEFLDLRKNSGSEDMRARDLFLAMWIPDLFMRKVKENAEWYLMCPNDCPGLNDVYGQEYEDLYQSYIDQKRYKRKVKASDIWTKILDSQIETGTPYLLYKDAANKKSNQKNIGVIKSSNLCSEILLYSDEKEYAVCNLASVALPKFVEQDSQNKPFFNHQYLYDVVKDMILPMNNVIDYNYYPTPETKSSNLKHRPEGLGIQGLHDCFIKMKYPFESENALKLNKEIFETMYYAALVGSMELAKRDGVYSTFKGSPLSQGKFQFDLWKECHPELEDSDIFSGRWDWETLRRDIQTFGVRNSTLLTCMPTASSAQIMGNSDTIEPIDSCIYKKRVLSGEYIIANKYLMKTLTELGLWNKEMKDLIILNEGSIQKIPGIPQDIKQLYKTVWEMSMKSIINQSKWRALFICQTQSMNLSMSNPNYAKLTSMHFYAWEQGLKTGMYYLRQKVITGGKFNVDPELEKKMRQVVLKEEEECLNCSA